jgi:hypothetical protein
MFFIPIWITNVLFLISCVIAGYQHTRFNRENPFLNQQFITIVVSLILIVVNVLYNHVNVWLTLVIFLLSVIGLIMTLRQQRMLPPNKAFE